MKTISNKKAPLWLLALICAYVAILVALTVLNRIGADRWWFGALNLYLPQVVWAIPGIVLAAVAFTSARQWIWAPLLCVVWVAGPVMGFCWPMHSPQELPGSLPLRVMTWNVKYGNRDKFAHLALRHDIDSYNPAIVLMQDSGRALNGPLGDFFRTWNVRINGQYVIASKLPIGELQIRKISFEGEEHTCVRTQIKLGETMVTLYNVHFLTPRHGLNEFRGVKSDPEKLPNAIQRFKINVEARHTQVQALREYVRQEQGPVIVAGDLNSPDASWVCATLRDIGLHDAFAEGGKGYGYTYGHFLLRNVAPIINTSWMRIDHIMMSSQFQSKRCWTGTGDASDHRPVIADLVLDPNSQP